ncbi:MAG: hypothetical protein IT288_08460 [Bdellovibrionales bacterium]|nr:hypothetical protein [Bdellovibrionales bacterium]
MYFLLGKEAVWDIVQRLASLSHERHTWASSSKMRRDLVDFYRMIQEVKPLPDSKQPLFCVDEARTKALLHLFSRDHFAEWGQFKAEPMEPRIQHQIESRIRHCLSGWKVLEPDLAQLFEVVVHTLFFQKSEGYAGGSIATAMGVIWVGQNERWGEVDWQEFLLHELTHQLLFLDDHLQLHFDDWEALLSPETMAQSAVLKIPRPFYLVFHSLIVAHEVLCYRRAFGEPEAPWAHPPSPELLQAALAAAASLHQVNHQHRLMTPRSQSLLELVRQSLEVLGKAR